MKILMLTRENEADKRYGLGRSLLPIVEELRQRGHEVGYLSKTDLGERGKRFLHQYVQPVLTFLFQHLPGATQDFPGVVGALLERLNMGRLGAKVARREGYTHVHCHDPWLALGYWLFSLFRSGSQCRWGITQHGFGSYAWAVHEDGGRMGGPMMNRFRSMERFVLERAAWVIAPTPSGIQQLARDLGIFPIPDHWYAVPHPLPSIRLYDREVARSTLGWMKDAFYILAVGRLVPLKQFPQLIEACAKLPDQATVQLVILGEGDTDALQRHAQQQCLNRPVIFAITDDIGLYLRAADLYVSLSSTESFGMANLEALAASTPAICSAVGGVPEVLSVGALLIPADTDAATIAINYLMNDSKARQDLALRGRHRAESWPGVTQVTARYEQIYSAA